MLPEQGNDGSEVYWDEGSGEGVTSNQGKGGRLQQPLLLHRCIQAPGGKQHAPRCSGRSTQARPSATPQIFIICRLKRRAPHAPSTLLQALPASVKHLAALPVLRAISGPSHLCYDAAAVPAVEAVRLQLHVAHAARGQEVG